MPERVRNTLAEKLKAAKRGIEIAFHLGNLSVKRAEMIGPAFVQRRSYRTFVILHPRAPGADRASWPDEGEASGLIETILSVLVLESAADSGLNPRSKSRAEEK